jgi:hypothetical protein
MRVAPGMPSSSMAWRSISRICSAVTSFIVKSPSSPLRRGIFF